MGMGYTSTQLPAQHPTVFFASHIDRMHDPIRNTRWRMEFGSELFKAIGVRYTVGKSTYEEKPEDFSMHIVGGAKVPEVKTAKQSIKYMGFEKKYPTVQEGLASSMTLNGILTEDARAYETVLLWNQRCLNTGILNATGEGDTDSSEKNRLEAVQDPGGTSLYLGLGQQENRSATGNDTYKVLRNSCVTLNLYDWNFGRIIMGIRLINAWPSSVTTSELSYESASLMKFNFTLEFDRFNIWFNKDYAHLVV